MLNKSRPIQLQIILMLFLFLQPDSASAFIDEQTAAYSFDALMEPQNGVLQSSVPSYDSLENETATSPSAGRVELSLRTFQSIMQQLEAMQQSESTIEGAAIVFSSADYKGQAISGALELTVTLQINLGREGRWKTVPLVGSDVILTRAALGEQPLATSVDRGFHVWLTKVTGTFTITLDILVPATGPRGSIEYGFTVVRTPVTHFSCRFPQQGLQPRIDAAVTSSIERGPEQSTLIATLRPTTTIHLVGFHDMGQAAHQGAKVYSESLNLLSIGEGGMDLFTVVRYTILYAGQRDFTIQLPPNMNLVSANGQGAFRSVVEEKDGKVLFKGETETPIQKYYEISLHLRRDMDKQGESFAVPLPQCMGVERNEGWLAIEVPGNLRLQEITRSEIKAVDVRQLPSQMISNAVSPILLAYHFLSPSASLEINAARLPEIEADTGSVDKIQVFSALSEEGTALTEMRITLRNRLRPNLALEVPEGTQIRSTLLDGNPVKASIDDGGRLILPLILSPGQQLEPFMLQVVMEHRQHPPGLVGTIPLSLPTVELPVSALEWSIFLPAANTYDDPHGDIQPQTYFGHASWRRPPPPPDNASNPNGYGAWNSGGTFLRGTVGGAETGAMPVRINLPKSGKRLEYARYWIEGGQPVKIEVTYVRSWLRLPTLCLLFVLLVGGGMLLLGADRFKRKRLLRGVGVAVILLAIWPLVHLSGWYIVFTALCVALAIELIRRNLMDKIPGGLKNWWRTCREAYRERRAAADLPGAKHFIMYTLGGTAFIYLLSLVVKSSWRVLGVLF